MDDISIAVVSIASEKEDDTNTNAAPHHCMPTLRDALGSIMDTLAPFKRLDLAVARR